MFCVDFVCVPFSMSLCVCACMCLSVFVLEWQNVISFWLKFTTVSFAGSLLVFFHSCGWVFPLLSMVSMCVFIWFFLLLARRCTKNTLSIFVVSFTTLGGRSSALSATWGGMRALTHSEMRIEKKGERPLEIFGCTNQIEAILSLEIHQTSNTNRAQIKTQRQTHAHQSEIYPHRHVKRWQRRAVPVNECARQIEKFIS